MDQNQHGVGQQNGQNEYNDQNNRNEANIANQQEYMYKNNRIAFIILIVAFQLAMLIVFGFKMTTNQEMEFQKFQVYFSLFQNSNMMIMIGFGFFMTSYKGYSWSAIAYTLLIYLISFQTYIIFETLVWSQIGAFANGQNNPGQIVIEQAYFIRGLYAVMTILIAFGAIMGKVGSFQLFILSFFGVIGYTFCLNILQSFANQQEKKLLFFDAGGSTYVHCFGAFLGLTVSRIIMHNEKNKQPKINYVNKSFSMIGVLMIWICWPSFNSGFIFLHEIVEYQQGLHKVQRLLTYQNTYFALIGSTISSYIFSLLFQLCGDKKMKLDINDIVNGSLAGGVMIGASSNLLGKQKGIGISLIIGFFAGFIAILWDRKVRPVLAQKFKIYDTRGVQSMHGIPGIIGGIISGFVILIYFHNSNSIRKDLVELKFFELPKNNFTDQELQTIIGQQFGAPFICMGIAIITGIVIGFSLKLLMKFSCIKQLDKNSQLTGFQVDDELNDNENNKHLNRLKDNLKEQA